MKQAEENPITPDTVTAIYGGGVASYEASRREPDHAGHGGLWRVALRDIPGSKQKRTRSRRTQDKRLPGFYSRHKQAEENPITPDTNKTGPIFSITSAKQAEENPITPDTDVFAFTCLQRLEEASRREPDHAGHRSSRL